ncbi:BrnT family toxin [Spirosoma koreense]
MEFEWDEGNLTKFDKIRSSGRNLTVDESESVFDDPKRLFRTSYPDEKTGEPRYRVTGLSNQNRIISVIFVIRAGKIRIFNAWKAKQTALKEYYAQTTDPGREETIRGEADPDFTGD